MEVFLALCGYFEHAEIFYLPVEIAGYDSLPDYGGEHARVAALFAAEHFKLVVLV